MKSLKIQQGSVTAIGVGAPAAYDHDDWVRWIDPWCLAPENARRSSDQKR